MNKVINLIDISHLVSNKKINILLDRKYIQIYNRSKTILLEFSSRIINNHHIKKNNKFIKKYQNYKLMI